MRAAETPIIHRAEWVVPVSAPAVRNGAVAVCGGRIADAGSFSSLRKSYPGAEMKDHGRAALFPALVNAHTHLELSALEGRIPFPQRGFRKWLEFLFSLRAGAEEGFAEDGLRTGMKRLFDTGTALCGDITNGGALIDPASVKVPERQVFLELLGFNLESIAAALPKEAVEAGAGKRDSAGSPALVPHSVYSVSPAIIAECGRWTRKHGLPFSIHVAEHPEEIEFLQTGGGFCRELLEMLGRWEPKWTPPGQSPVEYLDGLGVLDSRTLMVHAVHMTDSDWEIAARRGCTAVFCPRSNANIGAGRPRVEKAISLGINCALGTDSLASNTDLNLFAEAAFLLAGHPSIDPERAIGMVTVNPARALGREGIWGSIEPGAKATILAVDIPSEVDESKLYEALIHAGKEGAWKWIN